MNTKQRKSIVTISMITLFTLTGTVSLLKADSGTCGGANVTLPFNDVMNSIFFCQIAEAYFAGLTSGTSAITFRPDAAVTREQMAAFVSSTLDQTVQRSSQRAAGRQGLGARLERGGRTEKSFLTVSNLRRRFHMYR